MPLVVLPAQSTSFIGRRQELDEIAALLADSSCRLLTILGQGGIGKTRLAIQAAESQQPNFADGIFFVALAPVASPDFLPSTIAEAFGVSFAAAEEPHSQLMRYLQEKQILLVMDNFEHLLDGAAFLAEILQNATGVKMVVTSRERLNLQEEWVLTLDGLSYPTDAFSDPMENYSAIQLFVQRAQQVNARFSLNGNAAAVGAICQQVEGLPLGLELAAGWLRVMSCQQIAVQMRRNLDFLTTALRNIPERHRSVRIVFEQSWRFLSSDEQSVLMKLSVFRGGFDLEAAVQVAGASLPLLASLADKSLIRFNASGRYDLHELLRQYAGDKLSDAGMATAAIQQHFNYFLKFAEEAEAHLFGRDQIVWFDRLEVEIENLRAALSRSVQSEAGLRLAAALGWFFSECAYWREGLDWFERTFAANPNVPVELHAKALHLAGGLAGHFGDQSRLVDYCQQAIEIGKFTDNKKVIAWALAHLGLYGDTDSQQAGVQLQESIALFRQIGDAMGLAHCLIRLAWNAVFQKNLHLARSCVDEAAVLSEQAGDTIMLGWVNTTFARIALDNLEFKAAKEFFERSTAYFREAKLPDGVSMTIIALAGVEIKLGNLDAAEQIYKEALRLPRGLMIKHPAVPSSLAGLAHIALRREQYEYSARLSAVAYIDWWGEEPRFELNEQSFAQTMAIVRARMGESAFAAAWAAGNTMTQKEAIAYALEDQPSPTKIPVPPRGDIHLLTEREREILGLVADGLNSREIAERLVLSVETIRWYLKIIYSKLDVHSRSEAIARAKALNIFT